MKEKTGNTRAFELDFLRGLAIIMMILHHFIYDLRFIIGLDVFAWQESVIFVEWVRAPFVFIFLFVSGICCSFSKNNFRRSARMAGAALLFSLVFYLISYVTDSEMYVVFNILHLLAVGTLFYAFLSFLETRYSFKGVNAVLIFAGVMFLWLAQPLSKLPAMENIWLVPLYEGFVGDIGMADYMPLVPWIGMFFFGALFGRIYYAGKQSLFSKYPEKAKYALIPFEFVGRNSLLFYIFHQPVILAVLYLLKFLGIIG